ncbi:MAG: hypothetical protein QM488_07210 [Rhizobiaceae bacterium]
MAKPTTIRVVALTRFKAKPNKYNGSSPTLKPPLAAKLAYLNQQVDYTHKLYEPNLNKSVILHTTTP